MHGTHSVTPESISAREAVRAMVRIGLERRAAGDEQNARAMFLGAIEQDADCAEAYHELGVMASGAGHYDVAVTMYRRSLAVQPTGPHAAPLWCNVGNCLWRMQRYAEAEVAMERAFAMGLDTGAAHQNFGLLRYSQGRADDAIHHLRRSLEITPTQGARSDLSLAILKSGDLHAGLVANECRWETLPKGAVWSCGLPHWEGEDLDGKTIIVHHEQGYGDTIQFVRYCRQLAARGARVVFAAPPMLAKLIDGQCGIAEVIDFNGVGDIVRAARDAHYHCPMLSVLRVLGSTYGDVPSEEGGYLRAVMSPTTRRPFRTPGTRFAVGVVWAASPGYERSRQRSVPVGDLVRLAEVPGVRLFSLQVGPYREELAKAGAEAVITDVAGGIRDWADTAAIMGQLDLVISVDSGPAHLAGALGRPVWMFQPWMTCWRWCRGVEVWYPTMRAYQQAEPGSWVDVIAEMAVDLRRMVA